MAVRHRRFGAMVAVIAVISVGCGGAADGSPSAAASVATVAPSVVTVPPSEPASQPPAGGAGELCAVEFEPCPIEAGTYTTDDFTVPFTFTIEGEGWVNDRDWPLGGSVTRAGSEAFLWASGVTSGQVDGTQVEIGPSVDDFVAHLGRFDGWTLGAPVPVTIDGASGLQVDLTTNEVGAPRMYQIADDAFNLSPGEKARFIVVDKDGETVILIVNAFVAETFDTFVAEVGDPLLAGLTWD